MFGDSLFAEPDIARLLDATRSTSSLRSQQAMVDVASRSSSSSSRSRRSSPRRSPARASPSRRRRRESGSPARSPSRSQVLLLARLLVLRNMSVLILLLPLPL